MAIGSPKSCLRNMLATGMVMLKNTAVVGSGLFKYAELAWDSKKNLLFRCGDCYGIYNGLKRFALCLYNTGTILLCITQHAMLT